MTAPEVYYRSCDYCRKYIHDDNGVVNGPDDKPIERAETLPVNCTMCKKWDDDAEEAWEKFTRKNQYYFTVYRVAHAFGQLPRAGGIDIQDSETMENLLLLDTLFESHKTLDEKEFRIKLAGLSRGIY